VEREDHLTVEELAALLSQSAARGDSGEDEAALLEGVAAIGRFQARDVMTPRVDIRWLDPGAGAEEARAFAQETGFSMALVCEGTIDNGIVGAVDLAGALLSGASRVGDVRRDPVYVPESARLDQMLGTLRDRGDRLAVVVDEFGGVAGVASLRDVAHRILGAAPEGVGGAPEVALVEPGVWRAPGRLCVRDWEDALAALPEGGPTTLGGVVVARLGRLARVGDSVVMGNVTLLVESVQEEIEGQGGVVDWLLVSLSDEDPGSSAGVAP
jgi:putative hemolysin